VVVNGRQRGWGKPSEKGERLFNTHLYLIICLEEIVTLIKESIAEVVGLQLIIKWRICAGSWCDSNNKGRLCPILILLKIPRFGGRQTGVGRAKRGFGGKDGNEIDPHLFIKHRLGDANLFLRLLVLKILADSLSGSIGTRIGANRSLFRFLRAEC